MKKRNVQFEFSNTDQQIMYMISRVELSFHELKFAFQGRHIQTSLHSSPLHHGILYRSLPEDTPSIQTHYEPKYEHDPGGGVDENDDKSGLLHTALPAQPGISR